MMQAAKHRGFCRRNLNLNEPTMCNKLHLSFLSTCLMATSFAAAEPTTRPVDAADVAGAAQEALRDALEQNLLRHRAETQEDVDRLMNRLRALDALVEQRSNRMSVQLEEATYLGVAAQPAPAPVRERHGLVDGFGLMLIRVAEDSPAAMAGLQEGDVLMRLWDQHLINFPQLAALVRSYEPGDEIVLHVVRDGVERRVEVKLGTGKVMPLSALDSRDLLPPLPLKFDPARPLPFEIDNARLPFFDRLQNEPGLRGIVERHDEEGSAAVATMADGSRSLMVADSEGKLIYDGPWPTPESLETLQDDGVDVDLLRRRMEQLDTTRSGESEQLEL
jgi:hypothetical protein